MSTLASFTAGIQKTGPSTGLGAGLGIGKTGIGAGVGAGIGGLGAGAGVGMGAGGIQAGAGVQTGTRAQAGAGTQAGTGAQGGVTGKQATSLVTKVVRPLRDLMRIGGWLPASQAVLDAWLRAVVIEVTTKTTRLVPVMQQFQDLIENDSQLFMGFNQMFEGAEPPAITNYKQFILVMNKIIQEAPFYGDIGPPVFMVMSQAMNTEGGYTAFLNNTLNKQFKAMFDVWKVFLDSSESRYVLTSNPGGWFSPPALASVTENFDGKSFEQVFECDPNDQYWGYRSWDHFFNRELRPNIRPLELSENPNIINAACESSLYNISLGVRERDKFWIKGEPYSLKDMLNHDEEYAEQFMGGTVLQGFLAVTGYHRWHSPITGTVKKVVQVPGTYLVQSPALLGDSADPFLRSLAFLSSMSTRVLIFLESENPLIGLMCFIAVGMADVSTCRATVRAGQKIKRGDQMGMFHFGGSTHCLLFNAKTNIQFFDENDTPGELIKVRAAIAGVSEQRVSMGQGMRPSSA